MAADLGHTPDFAEVGDPDLQLEAFVGRIRSGNDRMVATVTGVGRARWAMEVAERVGKQARAVVLTGSIEEQLESVAKAFGVSRENLGTVAGAAVLVFLGGREHARAVVFQLLSAADLHVIAVSEEALRIAGEEVVRVRAAALVAPEADAATAALDEALLEHSFAALDRVEQEYVATLACFQGTIRRISVAETHPARLTAGADASIERLWGLGLLDLDPETLGYTMRSAAREYASSAKAVELFGSDLRDRAQRTYVEYFSSRAREQKLLLRGADGIAIAAQIAEDLPDLREAVRLKHYKDAGALADVISSTLSERGTPEESIAFIESVRNDLAEADLAPVLVRLARQYDRVGRPEDGVRVRATAIELASRLGDKHSFATAWADRAWVMFYRYDIREARDAYSVVVDAVVGDPVLSAFALSARAACELALGNVEAARSDAEATLEASSLVAGRFRAGGLRALGAIAMREARFPTAMQLFDDALADAAKNGLPHPRSLALGAKGVAYQYADQTDRAIELYQVASDYLRKSGVAVGAERWRLALAAASLEMGRRLESSQQIAELRNIETSADTRLGVALLELVLMSEGAVVAECEKAAETIERSISELVPTFGDAFKRAAADVSTVARLALDVARVRDNGAGRPKASSKTELETIKGKLSAVLVRLDPWATSLDQYVWMATRAQSSVVRRAVEGEGTFDLYVGGVPLSWFEIRGRDRVMLSTRESLRRVFVALVTKLRESPGDGLDSNSLFEAGWPGVDASQVGESARAARVHTTIKRLRDLGLDSLLERGPSGYRLQPWARINFQS